MKKIILLSGKKGYDLTDYYSGTNLVESPEDFTTGWILDRILAFGSGSIADVITSPDGNVKGSLITPNTVTNHHNVRESSADAVSGDCKLSIFLKESGYSKLIIRESNASGAWASFDIANGVVLDASGVGSFSLVSASIEDAGNGWYRCILIINGTGNVNLGVYILPDSYISGAISTWTPNGTDGMYLWGAKLEQL